MHLTYILMHKAQLGGYRRTLSTRLKVFITTVYHTVELQLKWDTDAFTVQRRITGQDIIDRFVLSH